MLARRTRKPHIFRKDHSWWIDMGSHIAGPYLAWYMVLVEPGWRSR